MFTRFFMGHDRAPGSGNEAFKTRGPSRVGSKSVRNLYGPGRVGRVQGVRNLTVQVGSGRVGSGRVGSGRVGSGRVGSGLVGSDLVGSDRSGL